MIQPANQQQLDAVLRGGLSVEEAMNPALLDAAGKNKPWADNAKPPPGRQSQPGRPFATGVPMYDHLGHMNQMQQYHGQLLGNMAQKTMDAWQDENDSRVSQEREMRRMQHEKEMKQMELDALLARLDQARGPAPRASFPGGAIY